MSLKDVFQEALNEWEWDDDIIHDESDNTDLLRTTYSIDEKTYSFVMWTDEDRQWISISLRSPISIPDVRRGDGAILLNYLNCGLSIGKLTMDTDDGYVLYSNRLDIEGSEAVPMIFYNMRGAAVSAFSENRFNAIAAVAYTKQKLNSIIQEFDEAVDGLSEETPDEL
jgi:hypothetical protein